MAAEQDEAETGEETASAEGAPTAEEENAEAKANLAKAEGEEKPPGEQEEADKDGDKPADEPKADDKPKPAEIPEEQLRAAALKYANRTMAAARRAAQATEREQARVSSENESLKTQLRTHTEFIEKLQKNPFAAIRELGFANIKAFVDAGIAAGGEPKPPSADDRVTQLEKMIRERDEKLAQQEAQQATEGARARVFAAVDKLGDRYDFATTEPGHEAVWDAIVEYHKIHGQVPDAAVFAIADRVEAELTKKFANVRKFKGSARAQGEKAAQAASAKAGNDAKKTGKTIASTSSSGAPSSRKYSLDEEERRRQVNEDMRAAGEL